MDFLSPGGGATAFPPNLRRTVALTQRLALRLSESFPLMAIAPWRKGAAITAGLFGQWMRIQLIGLRVRDAYDPKSGHFTLPFPGQDQRLQC